MKKAVFLALILLLLQGCAQMLPARVSEIRPGVFTLWATANMFASDESMHHKIDKKAESICQGKGFVVLDDKHQWYNQASSYNGTGIAAPYKTLNKTIQCKQA